MITNPNFRNRGAERLACNIEINACTVLDTRAARIVDLSIDGAQVRIDKPFEAGTHIHLDYHGELVWGTVAWAEIDRMGVRFDEPLARDHRLTRVIDDERRKIAMTPQPGRRTFGRRAA